MPSKTPDKQNTLLAIGRLGSPFGVQGFLHVHSYSGETGHFLALKEVILARDAQRASVRIEEVRETSKDVFIRIEGCSEPENAQRWTGWEVLVPRCLASPCKPGEYYITDLEGCALMLRGEKIGSILSVLEGGESSLLEVRLQAGRTVLVPFRKEFIGSVDMKARQLELLEDWILE